MRASWTLRRLAAAGALTLLALAAGPAAAQSPTCTERQLSSPPRVMFDCGNGLLLEREAATRMGFLAATGGAAVEVNTGAVLVEVNPVEGGFQIRTPHAIASVRGTIYAVDVTGGTTSVFVQQGVVSVRSLDDAGEVTLFAGQGVDVTPGDALEVRTWGAARVDALLARFGRTR